MQHLVRGSPRQHFSLKKISWIGPCPTIDQGKPLQEYHSSTITWKSGLSYILLHGIYSSLLRQHVVHRKQRCDLQHKIRNTLCCIREFFEENGRCSLSYQAQACLWNADRHPGCAGSALRKCWNGTREVCVMSQELQKTTPQRKILTH